MMGVTNMVVAQESSFRRHCGEVEENRLKALSFSWARSREGSTEMTICINHSSRPPCVPSFALVGRKGSRTTSDSELSPNHLRNLGDHSARQCDHRFDESEKHTDPSLFFLQTARAWVCLGYTTVLRNFR